ncbi:MAG: OmpA family protein [Cycloclasticus sp.]
MKLFKKFAAVTMVALLATGCASVSTEKWQDCAIAGAAIGGAAGGFGDDHDREDLLLSAVGGAIIGGTICALMAEEDVKPAPEAAPVLDTDGDGVLDDADQCPNSAPGAVVNALGCVAPLVLDGVNFHTDSAQLTEAAKAILAPIAAAHHTHHGDVNLLISGHTDSQGSATYNQSLSQKRAEAVVAFMVANGCDDSKLTAVGHGESQAVADNATKEGRAQNRRVELSVK